MNTCLVWCLAFATYLLFAGDVRVDELIAAFVLASLATVWAAVVRRCSRLRFAPSAEAFSHLLRALARLPAAAARTGRALPKVAVLRSSKRAQECRFRYGRTGARDRTRRALAVICASLAPDRFVVDVEPDAQTALLHDILRRSRVPDPRWLE